ncbi:MAG TPA: glycosyltransferase [Anaerolineales bacterium]|jgi:glycosyltransferase involved in cell wall biosynthesis
MRIAQMLDTLSQGGAQRMQVFLVESLQPLGVELTVISLREPSKSPYLERLQAAGARVVSFPFPRLFSPGAFINLVKFLSHEKFDLLHAYLTYSNIVGSMAGRLTGTPTIASLRNADKQGVSYTPKRAMLEVFAMRYLATRVMANGIAVAEVARKRLNNARKVDVIPNAVDLIPSIPEDERRLLRQAVLGDPGRKFILSVGRLTAAKGFHDLIDAFALVHAQDGLAALVIAGGGDLRNELNEHVAHLGLTGHILLLGPRDDVPKLLAAADIYVNSSHWEGTPVSVLEAMAAGLPVVATRVGENPYLLEPDAGLVVQANQPAELASALLTLLASDVKRQSLGQAARERIGHSYSRVTWQKSLLALYSEITPEAKPYLEAVLQNSLQACGV